MDAKKTDLLNFLNQKQQFTIPLYQRKYSWSIKECNKLWEDILLIGNDEEIKTHFLGCIVYMSKENVDMIGAVKRYMIIDGQQRVTTITLLIAALVDFFKDHPNDEINYNDNLMAYYLINDRERDDKKYKLFLTQDDNDSLMKIINNLSSNDYTPVKFDNNDSPHIAENFKNFRKQINESNVEAIFRGLSKLIIIYISLEQGSDNPQLIFESLNSTGLELSQADLIRNYILMDLNEEKQEILYNKYWHEMEITFEQTDKSISFDKFIRDYLTIKLGRIPKIKDVYEEFKKYSLKINSIDELVKDVYKYAEYYFKFALEKEEDPDLKIAFKNLNELKYDITRPFFLLVYEDYVKETINKEELLDTITLIESYLVRRAICDISAQGLNKIFTTLHKEIKKDNYTESLKLSLITKRTYKRYPENIEFKEHFISKDIYSSKIRNYLLRRLENGNSKENINVESSQLNI